MPKSKGPSTFPTGKRFPGDDDGAGQRHFTPGGPGKKGGPRTFPIGHRFGNADLNDAQKAHSPPPVKSKGPQIQRPTRLGDTGNQNQDPSRPFNP